MDALGWIKTQCPWHHDLPGLLGQLLLSLCFFSYLPHVKPMWYPAKSGTTAVDSLTTAPNGWAGLMSSKGAPCQATTGPPTHLSLLLLLWTWPFNIARGYVPLFSTADCQLTVNPQADAVLACHQEVSYQPKGQLLPSPRLLASAGSGSTWNHPTSAHD